LKSKEEQLLEKYKQGRCTPEEKALVESWYNKESESNQDHFIVPDYDSLRNEIWSKLPFNADHELPLPRKTFFVSWSLPAVAVAALFMLISGIGLYLYNAGSPLDGPEHTITSAADIKPGRNTATLTLADGRTIVLSAATNGELAKQAGVTITKTADGRLVYDTRAADKGQANQINTLTTARGEQYQVILPDGSKVWLNAASVLTYPACFSSAKERRITLKGEAYFEIAKVNIPGTAQRLPFVVVTERQSLTVLGTHFNVNDYKDEPVVRTTLLEGAVKVSPNAASKTVTLRPGQQSSMLKTRIEVADVNPINAVDWKNGEFRFKNEPLASILRRVSRWYDVEVSYTGKYQRQLTFSGAVSRLDDLSGVLRMLEKASDVRFSMEGKTIKVN
jgi:ferric-dicitrate binding protein FerR (iron transport regulator)